MRSTAPLRLAQSAFGSPSLIRKIPIGNIRHFLSIKDLTPDELAALVRRAAVHKKAVKSGNFPTELSTALAGQTVAMLFNKRSTRTRVSTEAAVALLGGHAMFLGKDDIQLGVRVQVNESLYDTSRVISSMTSCMVARVGPHSQVASLAKDSSVPVINALCDDFHPLQIVADFLTIHEAFPANISQTDIIPPALKIAWVGDANNVLFDLAIASLKLGVHIAVATPSGYGIKPDMAAFIRAQAPGPNEPIRARRAGKLTQHTVPEEAVTNADIIVTDTWVSMGQEDEAQKRLRDFEGFQVTTELALRSGAKPGWKFMHCLPRHPEEVSDDVFYSPRSLVFAEAENRLWAAVAALEAFVVKKGKIL
ncbi:ornithine carbamoyltransferase [Diatrype stigma]|uniref:Ornithine carbamoyltransferase, mitochondrial n=1 Tax=Diatrype stigma TaxID=117547 RepID=A0AAN9US92_9PEZI